MNKNDSATDILNQKTNDDKPYKPLSKKFQNDNLNPDININLTLKPDLVNSFFDKLKDKQSLCLSKNNLNKNEFSDLIQSKKKK